MEELWYKQLGFHNNPFSIKPGAFHNEIIGHDIDAILDKIEEGTMLFVKAPFGFGKSTILKHIVGRFGGKKRVIFTSAAFDNDIDYEVLLRGSSFIGKMAKKLPKGKILLIDEAQDLKKSSARALSSYYTDGNIKTVVFFGVRYTKSKYPPEINSAIGEDVVELNNLTPEQAVILIRKRIGNIDIISDEHIKKAYELANANPRRVLEICEELCRRALLKGLSSVDKSVVDELYPAGKRRPIRAMKTKVVKDKPIIQEKEQDITYKPVEIKVDKPKVKPVAVKKKKTKKRKPVKKKKVKLKEQKQEITIKEEIVQDSPSYNIENIRSYEEEYNLPEKKEY